MSCRFIFFFSIIYVCIVQNQAAGLKKSPKLLANDYTCYIEHYGKPLSEAEWIDGVDINSSILDVEPAFTKLYTARIRNVRDIYKVEVNNRDVGIQNYINYLLVRNDQPNDLDFILTVGTGFRKYEENETSIVMKINVTFLCEKNEFKSLEIRQKIIDTNNHDPKFIPSDFTFYVPEYVGVNHVIGQVTARDVDLTNNYINFNFRSTGNNTEGEYALLGSYQDQNDSKTFHALLVTRTNLSLSSATSIDIYAQDSGKPSRTDNTVVHLVPEVFTSTVTEPSTSPSPPPEEETSSPPPPPVEQTEPPQL